MNDSVFNLLEFNKYDLAKEKYLSISKKFKIDPDYQLFFLKYSLINNDLKFFKKNIKILIKNYGLHINETDSLVEDDRYTFLTHCNNIQIKNWLYKTSLKKHKVWIFKNSKSHNISLLLKNAIEKDRLVRVITFTLYPKITILDSISFQTVKNSYDLSINEVDTKNFLLIKELIKVNNNEIPNNFDNGIGIFGKISLIICHNLKRGINIENITKHIYPSLEKAYLQNKISEEMFYILDQKLYLYYGYQCYGTLSDSIPTHNFDYLNQKILKIKR